MCEIKLLAWYDAVTMSVALSTHTRAILDKNVFFLSGKRIVGGRGDNLTLGVAPTEAGR